MNNITLHMENHADNTLVSNYFIDNLMPEANGEFVKVYLYLLRCVSANRISLSVSEMADLFNQTEADVLRAMRYWDKSGALHLDFDANGTLTGVTFSDLSTNTYAPSKAAQPAYTQESAIQTAAASAYTVSDATAPDIHSGSTKTAARKPESYSMSQIEQFKRENSDFEELLFAIAAYMGESLTPTTIQRIAYFYDTLKFPTELIDYLVAYCVEKGHKSIRYIETVAASWANAGITSVNEAKLETANHNTTIYSVMNAFGISGRNPGQRERDFITKWTDVYCFDSDIIIEACNRTLKVTHQPSFEYADSILTKWNNANIKTAADIRKADAEYELLRNQKKASTAQTAAQSGNRFHNFHQRDTDIDSLERTLISNNS